MITKNLINQCEQAEEIQKAWKPKMGDWFLETLTKSTHIYVDGFAFLPQHNVPLSTLYIWLPTQEQLQEMMKYKFSEERKLLTDFYGWVVFKIPPFVNETMKEMLLMYVMKEKYNKSWTGNKWVKAE